MRMLQVTTPRPDASISASAIKLRAAMCPTRSSRWITSRTLNGKKIEVLVRRLLLSAELGQVASPNAMQNPATLAFFIDYAKELNRTRL